MSGPMGEDLISGIMSIVLLILLSGALVIFGWLAAKSRNIKKFQFQISVFLIIWIVGEIVDVFLNRGLSIISGIEDIGMQIHVGAMVFFCAMIWLRYYYSRTRRTRIVDDPADYYDDNNLQ